MHGARAQQHLAPWGELRGVALARVCVRQEGRQGEG